VISITANVLKIGLFFRLKQCFWYQKATFKNLVVPYYLPSFLFTIHQTEAAEVHGGLLHVFVWILIYALVSHDAIDDRKDQRGGFIYWDWCKIARVDAF
jgi:hypothetical protein